MTLRLRCLAEHDLDRVMRWRMLPEITRFMYTDPQLTMADQRAWFERINQSTTEVAWVAELDGPTPIGLVTLSGIDRRNARCSWAYYIAEQAGKGKGYGRVIECNIADFVFGPMGLMKLCCEVFASNERVVSLHEMFGSRREGLLREHIRKGQDVHDVVVMGLLKADWIDRRAALRYQPIEIDIPQQLSGAISQVNR